MSTKNNSGNQTKTQAVTEVPNQEKTDGATTKPLEEPITQPKKDVKTPVEKIARFKERAKQVFTSHRVDVLYFTDDLTAFVEPQYARMHAESLKNNEVTPVKREEVK
ncbi:MAG: hypothetical protein WCL00_00170 [Bacteroidota bacterium]